MEIAIVGAGIIGLTAAHRLAAAGHAVTIIAPRSEAHMSSTGNASTVAAYAVDPVGTPDVLRDLPRLLFNRQSPLAIHRPSALSLTPWLLRFLRQSLPGAAQRNRQALAGLLHGVEGAWRDLAGAVGGAGLIRETGAIYAYDTPDAVQSAQRSLSKRSALGVAVEMLDRETLEAAEPGLPKGRFAGGALFPGTQWMTDSGLMLARIDAAQQADRVEARVTALSPKGAGWRLTLDTGRTLNTQAVVVAAGAWSTRLLRPLGLRIPLTTERGYHLEFDMDDTALPVTRPVCPTTHGFYFTPLTGRLRVAGTVELGGVGAAPSPHRWDVLDAAARTVFPDLAPPSRRWMGLRPSMPDSLPVIGTAQPGLVLAFGHGHIGLTLAPRTADLVEGTLRGKPVPDAVSPARFSRP